MLGKISVEETLLQEGSTYFRPLAKALKVVPEGCSVNLQEAIVDFGSEDSFALASKRLLRHHDIELSQNKLRKITLSHAESIYESEHIDTINGQLPGEGADIIIAEADGTMLPVVEFDGQETDQRKNRVVKWEESKLCAALAAGTTHTIYGFGESPQDLGIQWPSV